MLKNKSKKIVVDCDVFHRMFNASFLSSVSMPDSDAGYRTHYM